jgi:hypothetical protein
MRVGILDTGGFPVDAAQMVLIACDALVAVTAIGGGVVLAAGLEGDRYPAGWLKGTPFRSYLIPGLILVVMVGGSAAAAAVLTLTAPQVGAWLSILAGVILIGQIAGEIRMLKQPIHWIEVVYITAGTLMVALGLTLRVAAL